MIDQFDPLQLSVCKLTLYRDDLIVGYATGFFYQTLNPASLVGPHHTALVTNWHVLSGRNSDDPTKAIHAQGAVPNRIAMKLFIGMDPQNTSRVQNQELSVGLFGEDGSANWLEHPRDGHLVDVAVITFGDKLNGYRKTEINAVADANDMSISLGDKIFILGYPLGFSHFIDTPIWKQGIIASEPRFEAEGARSRVIIDATTREGMSGSPVIRLENTHYLSEAGVICAKPRASRLVGVYASRPNLQKMRAELGSETSSAEIGYVYKINVVNEIIQGDRRGPSYGVVP